MDVIDPGEPSPDNARAATCPRCGQRAMMRYYGPCEDCRGQLRARFAGSGRAVESGAFVPRMHVTPNAVAQKE